MSKRRRLWQARFAVAPERVAALESALEPLFWAVSSFAQPGGAAWIVTGLVEGKPDRAALKRASGLDPVLAPIDNADWVTKALSYHPPLTVDRIHIRGSHHPGRPPAGARTLRIDAGIAFGTGQHESTQGCLALIGRLARARRIGRGLDLGCGSGVLAMAMARLWASKRILAIDIDPRAVGVARQNVRRNGLGARIEVRTGARPPGRARFDLIAANILARPLIRLAPALGRAAAARGHVVLSGLLTGQEAGVIAAYVRAGFGLAGRWRRNGWSALMLKKRTRAPEGRGF
ncbi:MAG: 50S ribosomal protein L11 methyltransferase [Alphaproteobacteria bacterium]|nr:50S ribosomal protein L11 methyltransferase [Alphaproteobacteria bacterium]